jgi:hypothetical protein
MINLTIRSRLQTWARKEGPVRLSTDDGPPAASFLDDAYDDDSEDASDDVGLVLHTHDLSNQQSIHDMSPPSEVEAIVPPFPTKP